MTALPGWTPAIIKLPVSFSVGHWRFSYRQCPNLNLREISESESEANSTHFETSCRVQSFLVPYEGMVESTCYDNVDESLMLEPQYEGMIKSKLYDYTEWNRY